MKVFLPILFLLCVAVELTAVPVVVQIDGSPPRIGDVSFNLDQLLLSFPSKPEAWFFQGWQTVDLNELQSEMPDSKAIEDLRELLENQDIKIDVDQGSIERTPLKKGKPEIAIYITQAGYGKDAFFHVHSVAVWAKSNKEEEPRFFRVKQAGGRRCSAILSEMD